MSDLEAFRIFDVHQHVGSTVDADGVHLPGQVSGTDYTEAEMASRMRTMSDGGIAQALVSPGHSYDRSDGIAATRRVNDAIAAYRDHSPERFPIAAGIVEPRDGAAGFAELARIHGDLGLVAVSFHTTYQGVAIDNDWLVRYVEKMGQLGMVPLIHAPNDTYTEALWRLAKVARMFPDITFVALEPFFSFEAMLECYFVADIAPNIVFDTATCWDFDVFYDLVIRVGAQRIVYGSQLYSLVNEPGVVRSQVRRAGLFRDELAASALSEDDKAAIFGGNARRVFSLTVDGASPAHEPGLVP